MKRIFIALFLILSLVICLPSCEDTQTNPDFVRFNEMLSSIPSTYKITVSTASANGHTLNNEYSISNVDGVSKIAYRIETLNEFIFDDNGIALNEYKTVTEGVCENAQQVPGLDKYYNPTFVLSSGSIGTYTVTEELFSAQITSLKKFMRLDAELDDAHASNVKLTISYSESSVNYIEIIYVTEAENTIVITYIFK